MEQKDKINWQHDEYQPGVTYARYVNQLSQLGYNYAAVAAEMNVTEKQAWHALKRYGVMPDKPITSVNSVEPDMVDKVHPELHGWDLLDHAIGEQQYREKRKYWQDDALVKIDVAEPAIIVYSSDWHFGSLATDHEHVARWLKFFLEEPDIYMVTAGVDMENRSVFRSHQPTVDQVMNPEDQLEFLRWLWQEMVKGKKIVAACWDNHLIEQQENLLGYSAAARHMGEDVVYFRGRGLLTLKIGSQEYTHFLTHKARFNSSLNAAHGIKQQARIEGVIADVVVAGHIHNPDVEQYWEGGRPRTAVMTGTFKTDDPYSVRHFAQGIFAAPTLVYHHDTHKIVAFRSVDEALTYREGWRQTRGN